MKDRNMYYTNINSVFNERRSDWVNKCEMLKFIESRVAAYQIKGYQVYITKKNTMKISTIAFGKVTKCKKEVMYSKHITVITLFLHSLPQAYRSFLSLT